MLPRSRTWLLLATLVLASCMPRQYVLVKDPTVPNVVGHVLVVPPPGREWFREIDQGFQRGVTYMRYGSPGPSSDHTILAHVEVVPMPADMPHAQFESVARQYIERGSNQGRIRARRLDFSTATVNGMACVTYDAQLEDTGATFDRRPHPFNVIGQICRNPVHPDEFIVASFSERSGPPEFAPETRAQATGFLGALRSK
jgi:hypothetical protein